MRAVVVAVAEYSSKFVLPISEFMQARFKKAFPSISEEELVWRVNEFLKYIYLSSLKLGKKGSKQDGFLGPTFIPVKKIVDEIWNEFILQTREYENLCKSLPGKVFIHHSSGTFNEYTDKVGLEETMRRLLNFLPGYIKYFGHFDENSAKYWIIPDYLISNNILSLEKLNNLLKNELDKNPDNF